MAEQLTSMRNIGKEMERKLQSVDICTAEDLVRIGSKEAYLRLKLRFSNVCLVHLYTLHGAIENMQYNQLPDDVKRDLKSFSDSLK